MRLFPEVNFFFFLVIGAGVLLPPAHAAAQSRQEAANAAAAAAQKSIAQATALRAQGIGQKAIDRNSYLQGLQAAMQVPAFDAVETPEDAPPEEKDLGSINDPDSPAYKADKLGRQSARQRDAASVLDKKEDVSVEAPPPEVEALQNVNLSYEGKGGGVADDPISKEISLDMRKEAQKEAALSYGARGGLAKRNHQIMERMRGFDPVLDKTFNFRALLIKAPSGMLIEPPIVKESIDALVITEEGNEAAVAEEVYDINKQAKIVSAPRDWRQYLMQSWSDVPPPPRVLWPKNPAEQASWNSWVASGWKAGFDQADQIFESNTNRMVADYSGMVRYRMLLAQGMISAPYAMQEDRGVTGNKKQMRVGDRALRITGPSQFLTGADLWKPADR